MKAHAEQLLKNMKYVLCCKKDYNVYTFDIEYSITGMSNKLGAGAKVKAETKVATEDRISSSSSNIHEERRALEIVLLKVSYNNTPLPQFTKKSIFLFPHALDVDFKNATEFKQKEQKVQSTENGSKNRDEEGGDEKLRIHDAEILEFVKEQTMCRDIVYHASFLPEYDNYVNKDDFLYYFSKKVMQILRNSPITAYKKDSKA